MRSPGNACSPLERTIAFTILLCLAAVAIGVFRTQFTFNPAVLVARDLARQPAAAPSPAATPTPWLSAELKEFGPPERFTPDNLYDKIDGKAELYLAAGVAGMHCQRFALRAADDQWLEWFVYEMTGPSQAFSVFSTQRRSEGESLDLTPYAYRTRNALYFVCGSNYVEAVASSEDAALMQAVLDSAKRFAGAGDASSAPLPELQILPADNVVPGSQTLQSTDAFGFDQFKNVFTAQYKLADGELMAFVMACPGPDAAATLRDAYRSFLLENGGKESPGPPGGPFGKPVEIMGTVELVFSHGRYVAGIHSAPSLAAAEQLAARLQQRLAEKAR